MIKRELYYKSKNKINDVHATIFYPDNYKEVPVKGIVQIIHGMCEHIGRYERLAKRLTDNGYVVFGNDHIGHGLSSNGTYGYMGDHNGTKYMLGDIYTLYKIVRETITDAKYFVLGHSMGSYIARCYVAKRGHIIDGLILSATSDKKLFADPGIVLFSLLTKIEGGDKINYLVKKFSFLDYNRYFMFEDGSKSYITKDIDEYNAYKNDEHCDYLYTNAGLKDVLIFIKNATSDKWFKSVPVDLPVFLLCGDADPLGSFSRDVYKIKHKLENEGVQRVEVKIYENCRHEVLNETLEERTKCEMDILEFFNSIK